MTTISKMFLKINQNKMLSIYWVPNEQIMVIFTTGSPGRERLPHYFLGPGDAQILKQHLEMNCIIGFNLLLEEYCQNIFRSIT